MGWRLGLLNIDNNYKPLSTWNYLWLSSPDCESAHYCIILPLDKIFLVTTLWLLMARFANDSPLRALIFTALFGHGPFQDHIVHFYNVILQSVSSESLWKEATCGSVLSSQKTVTFYSHIFGCPFLGEQWNAMLSLVTIFLANTLWSLPAPFCLRYPIWSTWKFVLSGYFADLQLIVTFYNSIRQISSNESDAVVTFVKHMNVVFCYVSRGLLGPEEWYQDISRRTFYWPSRREKWRSSRGKVGCCAQTWGKAFSRDLVKLSCMVS